MKPPNPPPPPPPQPAAAAAISRAADIQTDPAFPRNAPLPRRYAAYARARARFWEAFPDDGAYVRLATPGTGLECGLHALILSFEHQAAADGGMRAPTLGELRAVCLSLFGPGGEGEGEGIGEGMGTAGEGWYTADQVAAVFAAWGRRYCARGDGEEGVVPVRCQLGWVTDPDLAAGGDRGWPVMMNTPEVETGEVGDGIVRVWVWNDGRSMRGGVGHFEGIRRPTASEIGMADEDLAE